MAYKQLVRPVLEFASAAWNSAFNTAVSRLKVLQRETARLIGDIKRTYKKTSTSGLLQKLDLKSLSEHRCDGRLKVFSQYHLSSKTAINNYVQRASFPSAPSTANGHFLSLLPKTGALCR